MIQGNQRLPHESHSIYRARLKKEAVISKYRLRCIWPSHNKGTYRRAKHGEIGRKLKIINH